MSTLELGTTLCPLHDEAGSGRLTRWWRGWRARRQRRRTLISLWDLDDRLLRDVGLEPRDVIDALENRYGPSVLFDPVRR